MICILNTTLFEKNLDTGQRKKGGGTMVAFLQKTLCWLSSRVTGNQQLGPQFQSNPEECWGPPATERETEIENTDGGQESRKGPQAAAGRGATNLQM